MVSSSRVLKEEVLRLSEDKLTEELKREIKSDPKLKKAPQAEKPDVDLSAEKALLEKLRAEGKLEEEED